MKNNQETTCKTKTTKVDNFYSIKISKQKQPCGYINFKLNPNNIWLYVIFVNEPYRNQGFGKQLLCCMEQIAEQHNINTIEGKYLPQAEDKIVRSFYNNNGYEVYKESYETLIYKYLPPTKTNTSNNPKTPNK